MHDQADLRGKMFRTPTIDVLLQIIVFPFFIHEALIPFTHSLCVYKGIEKHYWPWYALQVFIRDVCYLKTISQFLPFPSKNSFTNTFMSQAQSAPEHSNTSAERS